MKKRSDSVHGKGFSPVDRVKELAGRGFSEPEMIDVLRRESFSAEEIDNALTQAMSASVGGPSNVPQEFNPPEPKQAEQPKLPTMDQLMPESQMPQVPETSLPDQYYQQYPSEDYINAVVQSRMSDVEDNLRGFSDKYQELIKTVGALQNKLDQLSNSRSTEQQQILAKIGSLDDDLNDIATKLGGLEKAFKDTLPALIESVRSLSDIVQILKKEG